MKKNKILKFLFPLVILLVIICFFPRQVESKEGAKKIKTVSSVEELFSEDCNNSNIKKTMEEYDVRIGLRLDPNVTVQNLDGITDYQYISKNKKLYCIYHNQTANTGWYYIRNAIKIEGRTATNLINGKTKTANINAKMAYILNREEGYGDVTQNSYAVYSTTQVAVYMLFNTWYNKVGAEIGVRDEFNQDTKVNLDTEPSGSNNITLKATEVRNLLKEADDYADKLADSSENSSQVTIINESEEISATRIGNNYRIGPFKWKFSGDLSNVKVYDKNNKEIEIVKIADTADVKIGIKGIKSNKKFWIYISSSSGIIKKVTGTITAQNSIDTIYCTRIRLMAHKQVTQNFLGAEGYEKTPDPVEDDFSFTVDPKETAIIKYADSTNKSVTVEGITVGIKNWQPSNSDYKKAPKKSDYEDDEEGYDKHLDAYNYYIESQNTYMATGTSDKNGKIILTAAKGKKIRNQGTWDLYEISSTNIYFAVTEEKRVKRGIKLSEDVEIENKRTYVNIEGIVFADGGKNKTTTPNALYDNKEEIAGIIVTLKKNGKSVASTTSNSKGEYKFDGSENGYKIKVSELNKYSVEFTYNGMKYEPIQVDTAEKGSKATDISGTGSSTRGKLNNNYNTITNTSDVEYNFSENTSTVKYSNPEVLGDVKYRVIASTDSAGFEIKNNYKVNSDTISNINFGMVLRDQPNIALVKDIDSATVSINGASHIYKYEDRFDAEGNSTGYDVGVKFGQQYGNMTYKRALYPSDINYNEEGKGLEVKVKYKIGIKNLSTTYATRVNQIVDYYSEKFDIGTQGNNITITTDDDSSITAYSIFQQEELLGITIDTGDALGVIQPNEQKVLYIEFKVSNEEIKKLVTIEEGIEEVEILNYAEIMSYTIFKENIPVAGIDSNSQPGNLDPRDTSTYEDDSDKAPGLKLVVGEERKISGKVFVDKSTNIKTDGTDTGNTRNGNGVYEADEPGLGGVKVTLYKAVLNSTGEVQKGEIVKTDNTDNEGIYELVGFIPDNYVVEYEWGDENYTVQNYKSTTVDQAEWNRKENNDQWYKDNIETRVSDAVDDDYAHWRNIIDGQTSQLTNSEYKEIEKAYNGDSSTGKITKMNATTPEFKVNLEYDDTEATTQEEEYDVNGDILEGFKNKIANIDFGITERARQELTLGKSIEAAKLTLVNGMVLIDAKIGEDGKLVDTVKYTQYLPKTEASEQLKIEVDNEIIQGATIEITYKLTIENTSEIDYATEDYYYYGIIGRESDIPTLTPQQVIDYIDNSLVLDERLNEGWKLIDMSNMNFENNPEFNNYFDDSDEMKEYWKSQNKVAKLEITEDNELRPTGENTKTSYSIKTSKILSNNDEEISDNHAEIIKVEKSYGSLLTTIPGNYIPSNSETIEVDNNNSGNVIIIPPTGLSTEYIAYTLLTLSSLGILTTGIILIKKYVLKK